MPAFKKNVVVNIAKDVRAYLKLDAGVTRRGIEELRAKPDGNGSGAVPGSGVRPENIVWIFGSGRSGSTWLSSMMGDIEGHGLWGEPWVGTLFGNFYFRDIGKSKHQVPHFIMGSHRETWLGSIRNFVLNGARAIFSGLSQDGYLIIKEPNGSIGAPLMMEALPESRMILLTRDPRDVVASSMDARREGGWHYEKNKKRLQDGKVLADENPLAFVENRAKAYLQGMGKAKEAYDAHRGYKVLVRYEDLRIDTLASMKRTYSTLNVPVDEEELARAVEKHSWGNVPAEKKGEGKFHRKASLGGWKEDLTLEQAKTVERITAPLLREFYPREGQSEDFGV